MRLILACWLLLLPLLAEAEVVTIAVIGDTQNGTKCDEPNSAWTYTVEAVNWLATQDVAYAIFVGDLTNGRTFPPDCWCAAQTYGGDCGDLTNPYTESQCTVCNDPEASACAGGDGESSSTGGHNCEWTRTRTLVDTLQDAGIPWATIAGNHDRDGVWSFEEYNSFFGEGNMTSGVVKQGTFVDSVGGAVQSASFYNVFNASGIQWLHIGVGASQAGVAALPQTQAWVSEVIADRPKMPTIITAHQVVDVDGQCPTSPVETYWCGDGVTIFQDWATSPQVFMAVGGHIRDVLHATTTTPAGVKLIGIATDWSYRLNTIPAPPAWQDEESPNNGGGGVVALLDIDPVAGTISMRSYSPEADEFDERYDDDGDTTQATFWTEHLQFCGASRFSLPDAACADYVKPMAPRRTRDRQHGVIRGAAY